MPLRKLIVGPLEANCYVVWEGREALLVDAGGEAERIARELEGLGLSPGVLFLTHGHVDHMAACGELKDRFPDMKLAVLGRERELLMRPSLNLSLFLGGGAPRPPEPDMLLKEGDVLSAGRLSFRVIAVPGHTPGGAALFGRIAGAHEAGEDVVFSGDALFAGSVGRADLPGGDEEALLCSIREKLFTLPDETRVYPGHGPPTTIGEERASNPFFV